MNIKRIITLIISIIMLLTLSVVNASAEEKYKYEPEKGKCVYVSDNGSDSNDGSESSPYKTLRKAYTALSDSSNTKDTSGGYIIIKDGLTVFDSEKGQVTSAMDSTRFRVDFSSLKHTNKITICGATKEAKLYFANEYISDYKSCQSILTFGGPIAFENLEFLYSNGRVTFVSSEYLHFSDTVFCMNPNNDVYVQASGTVGFFGGSFNHIFAPNSDKATTVSVGGSAIINSLWTGLGSIRERVTVNIYDDAQISTVYLGGQASIISNVNDIFILGGKIGSISIYNPAVFKGKVNLFYAGIPSGAPAVAASEISSYFLDTGDSEGISEEMKSYTFEGVLKVKNTDVPSAKIPNGHIAKAFTVEALDSDGKKTDFPYDNLVVPLPDELDVSENYRIYAYNGSSFTECQMFAKGEMFAFKAYENAKSYALVHMGSEAPKASVNTDNTVGGVDIIENPIIGTSNPANPNAGDNKGDENAADYTFIIIAVIIALTVVCEIAVISSGKKKSAK